MGDSFYHNDVFFFKSFEVYNSFRSGADIKSGEMLAMATQPFVSSIVIIVSVLLLFIDYSKLHLLWFYPLLQIAFDSIFAKRILKIIEYIDTLRKDTNS